MVRQGGKGSDAGKPRSARKKSSAREDYKRGSGHGECHSIKLQSLGQCTGTIILSVKKPMKDAGGGGNSELNL